MWVCLVTHRYLLAAHEQVDVQHQVLAHHRPGIRQRQRQTNGVLSARRRNVQFQGLGLHGLAIGRHSKWWDPNRSGLLDMDVIPVGDLILPGAAQVSQGGIQLLFQGGIVHPLQGVGIERRILG